MSVQVRAPHDVPFRIREIVDAAVEFVAAGVVLNGPCLYLLGISHDDSAQDEVLLSRLVCFR